MQKTPLHSIHQEFGGRMVKFAGWEMPVQYQGTVEEHRAVRERVGVFDVSHMGELEVRGRDALAFVQHLTCNDVEKLEDGRAQYSAFLTPEGTFVDDIVLYRFDARRILICVNAATTEKDYQWLLDHRRDEVEIENRSADFAQIAVQGPQSRKVMQPLTSFPVEDLPFYHFTTTRFAETEAILSRTGYTGELGYELYVPPAKAADVWRALFSVGEEYDMRAAGLAARNSLRLEMKYPLYGNDIDEDHTPLQAGLSWMVKMGTGFIGEDALQEAIDRGLDKRLVGFEMTEPGIARDGYAVMQGKETVGTVTSGGFSPTLNKSIGLAYLPLEMAEVGTVISVSIRNSPRAAQIVKTPFYQPSKN